MSNQPKIHTYNSLSDIAVRLRSDLKDHAFVLLYAYNGTGKTRLSMAFKDRAKQRGNSDTLYFNAFTEDLFSWYNDLENDTERYISDCIRGIEDEVIFERAVNLLSHGSYSIFNPVEMGEDTKNLFKNILQTFLDKYQFHLPELLNGEKNS